MDHTISAGEAPDYDEIVRVVQLYVDGFQGDSEKLRDAFHEDAWIFAIDAAGELGKGLVSDRFERWSTSRRPIKGRFISVTQAGDIASVLLGFDNMEDLSDSWVDVIALMRVDGAWQITNKTAAHSSRAAWAKP